MPWPWPPLHRVYRAFDQLTDEQAEGEVRRMLRGSRREICLDAGVFGACVWGVTSLGMCCSSGWVISSFTNLPAPLAFLIAILVGGVLAFLGGTWRYQRLAARALDARMTAYGDEAWNICEKCRYPLGGLPPYGDCVVCPECGQAAPLTASRLAAAGESIKQSPD